MENEPKPEIKITIEGSILDIWEEELLKLFDVEIKVSEQTEELKKESH